MTLRRQFLLGSMASGIATFVGNSSLLAQSSLRGLKCVALVIGVKDYLHMPPLETPLNDARAVAEKIEASLRIKPTVLLNPTAADLRQQLADLLIAAADADVVLVYYAGHGIQAVVKGAKSVQCFVPKDFYLPPEVGLEQAIDDNLILTLSRIEEPIRKARKIGIVFWDACRDNPFYSRVSLRSDGAQVAQALPGTRTRGIPSIDPITKREIGSPVAQLKLDRPEGVVIHNATQPARTADDGAGKNGPYATGLVKHFGRPGVGIYATLSAIATDVYATTGGRQDPQPEGGLRGGAGDFVLVPAVPAPKQPTQSVAKSSPTASSPAPSAAKNSGGGSGGNVSGASTTARRRDEKLLQIDTKSTTMFQ